MTNSSARLAHDPHGASRGSTHSRPHDHPHAGAGAVLHSAARYYDLMTGLFLRGRERAFRERLVDLAQLEPGDRVLDVGCGTGSIAVAARRRVGPEGTVAGVDASEEMVAIARRKAARAGLDVQFEQALAQALPFHDGAFGVVLSTLMLHHLPRPDRSRAFREVRRVLVPGGRVLVVDFATPAAWRTGLLARVHRHGHVDFRDVAALLDEAGFEVIEDGAVGARDMRFALATSPRPASPAR